MAPVIPQLGRFLYLLSLSTLVAGWFDVHLNEDTIEDCNDEHSVTAALAIERAVELAEAGRDNDDFSIFQTWFGRNQENLCKMKSLLNRIVVTDLKSIKTSFVCVDTRVQPSRCEETGVGAVSLQDGGRWRIELCDAFFQVESLYGKSSGEKGVCKPIDPSARHRVADRGMIILHELMHNNFLFRDLVWAPLPIKDGDYCYKPSDITAAAKGGNLRVSMICWDLLTAASSYQYYAQAALTQGVACLNPTKNNGMAWANCKNLFPDW